MRLRSEAGGEPVTEKRPSVWDRLSDVAAAAAREEHRIAAKIEQLLSRPERSAFVAEILEAFRDPPKEVRAHVLALVPAAAGGASADDRMPLLALASRSFLEKTFAGCDARALSVGRIALAQTNIDDARARGARVVSLFCAVRDVGQMSLLIAFGLERARFDFRGETRETDVRRDYDYATDVREVIAAVRDFVGRWPVKAPEKDATERFTTWDRWDGSP